MPDITPHQLRHMWGTSAAAQNFSAHMIQAAMGHERRVSAEAYIDHTQHIAAEVAATVITFPSQNCTESCRKMSASVPPCPDESNLVACPKCGHKFNPPKSGCPRFSVGTCHMLCCLRSKIIPES